MTKPRLAKVRALFYVLRQITKKETAPILTQPHIFYNNLFCLILAGSRFMLTVFALFV